MGLIGWLGGAAHSIRHGFGSFGNDVDNTFGNTNNIQNASNIGYNVGTSVSRGLINNTWGYAPDGRYSAPVGDAFGDVMGYRVMAEVNPAHDSARHLDFQPSESKHISTNTTVLKKKN